MTDERSEQIVAVLQADAVPEDPVRHLGPGRRRVVRERVPLQPAPDLLDRVELRRVGRQFREVEATRPSREGADRPASVGVQPVPDDDGVIARGTKEIAEEVPHPVAIDVLVRRQGEAKSYLPSLRRDHERRDRRGLLTVTAALVEDGGLATRRPGAAHERRREEAALVEENEVGLQPRRFFFTRGHSSLTQRWISASSRSRARRSGFWGDQPKERRSRPT